MSGSAPSTTSSSESSVFGGLCLGLSRWLFGAFVFLVLSLRSTWLRDGVPTEQMPEPLPALGGFALPIAAALAICVLWLAGRLLERPPRRWRWGRPAVSLPLLGLSLVALVNLRPELAAATSLEIPKLLVFSWFAYLFAVNERPALTAPLALAVAVQGTLAISQFLLQSDLGLRAIGELPLATEEDGISILWVQERAWIRAYGMTDHPNWLGANLSACALVLLSALGRHRAAARLALAAAIALGILGLMASFSRAAWLGFGVGLLALAAPRLRTGSLSGPPFPHTRALAAALALLVLLFLVAFRDLVTSRVVLGDNPVEARSVAERLRDTAISLRLIADHPLRGVGTGDFTGAAQRLNPEAITVHNVTLLVAAELGLPGLALWLWLVAGSLLAPRRARGVEAAGPPPETLRAIWLPPWVSSLVVGLFDPNPWPLLMLTSAVLFGLMLGGLAGSGPVSRGSGRPMC